MTFLEERTIGPELGQDSIDAGRVAAVVGMVAVSIFMIASYGLFGIFANIALAVNMALIFAVLSLIGATLTLPGIGGIVLTIGMAVDANVLVYERIREELRQAKSPGRAIELGYERALSAIVDANLTTLITAIVLFVMGAGAVKGFAVTLGIGIRHLGLHGDLHHARDHRAVDAVGQAQNGNRVRRSTMARRLRLLPRKRPTSTSSSTSG